ncbi:beta-lactamase-like protein [Xylariomycetidae sp. FL2044]|nr:beta-lactamase-like protein [Xylariomycetidae sp. FL2044]
MSTFDGYINEFPDIRIDHFRSLHGPALAYFLSHVHSDHLTGLETFKSPFIYCSPATREILLRLEKWPVRVNLAKGLLENPHQQTYKALKKILKPIPLDTPTTLELSPGHDIQVTLLDANHCVGAVMFLIEGDGHAILYTGDIRSEPWFVNSIARHPAMVEYSSGLKTLDRIYLDTSIISDEPLQTKAEGLRELLHKVRKYPDDTIFHLQAWTYGYEEVWIALAKALKSKIHVDHYKYGIYRSLATKATDNRFAAQTHLDKLAPSLAGFTCGNRQYEGYLTKEEDVRIHSCEKGMGCKVMENKPVVWLKPIVAHLEDGEDWEEVGIGGGGDDLARDGTFIDGGGLEQLKAVVGEAQYMTPETKEGLNKMLNQASVSFGAAGLRIDLPTSIEEPSIPDILQGIATKVRAYRNPVHKPINEANGSSLPRKIRFPYARHSSLPELRLFVDAFKPRDVWPNTVDRDKWIKQGITIKDLFGDYCSGSVFPHDILLGMIQEAMERQEGDTEPNESQETRGTSEEEEEVFLPTSCSNARPPEPDEEGHLRVRSRTRVSTETRVTALQIRHHAYPAYPSSELGGPSAAVEELPDTEVPDSSQCGEKRDYETFRTDQRGLSSPSLGAHPSHQVSRDFGEDSQPAPLKPRMIQLLQLPPPDETDGSENEVENEGELPRLQGDSQTSNISDHTYAARLHAYETARANLEGREEWGVIGLISTTDNHSSLDVELGES